MFNDNVQPSDGVHLMRLKTLVGQIYVPICVNTIIHVTLDNFFPVIFVDLVCSVKNFKDEISTLENSKGRELRNLLNSQALEIQGAHISHKRNRDLQTCIH